MIGWPERRAEILETIAQLPERQSDPASSSDEVLHQAILRILDIQNNSRELAPHLSTIAADSLSASDFRTLSTLSSSGPFNRVELAMPNKALTGSAVTHSKIVVLKTVDRRWAFRMRQQQSIAHEIAVLRSGLDHDTRSAPPRIPKLIASFLSHTACHVVLSYAEGGDMWGLLESYVTAEGSSKNEALPEAWVKFWTAEMVDALEWLHDTGWVHRDIKPHNLLLLPSGHLQLTDFGSVAPLLSTADELVAHPPATSSRFVSRKFAVALVGTPDYIAPEVLKYAELVAEESTDFESSTWRECEDERAYGDEVDWWATGIVAYELLFGKAPFFAEAIAETYEQIIDFKDHLVFPDTPRVTADARDFIARLLKDPDDRLKLQGIKQHEWFRQIDWTRLRNSESPYIPPTFERPTVSPTQSFSHQYQSSDSFTTFTDSFFSSPGLSILRVASSSSDVVQKEARRYWEAAELGGLTVLPAADAFDSVAVSDNPISYTSSQLNKTSTPAPRARPAHLPFSLRDMSRFSYETPARSLRSEFRSDSARQAETGMSGGSTRSRRMISDVEAWKEMQEHAWEVGSSAKKHQRSQGRHVVLPTGGRGASKGDPYRRATGVDGVEPLGGEQSGRDNLGSLESRQREIVKELEEMGEKYGSLFALVKGEGT